MNEKDMVGISINIEKTISVIISLYYFFFHDRFHLHFTCVDVGSSLGALSSGRVSITVICSHYMTLALTIAIRYCAVRKQFGPTDKDDELPVIEYQAQVCISDFHVKFGCRRYKNCNYNSCKTRTF